MHRGWFFWDGGGESERGRKTGRENEKIESVCVRDRRM